MRRCKHQWAEVGRMFNPSVVELKSVRNISEDALFELTYGFTVVELQCRTCGDIKFERTPGRPAAKI